MIHDRYGTIDRGTYTFYPGILKSAEFFGLDPQDPVYRERAPRQSGWRLCRTCGCHHESDRWFPCDVMKARIKAMEDDGYPATLCSFCHYAMPVRAEQSRYQPKCWWCEAQEKKRRRPKRSRKGGVYVEDGLGCVEMVPSWSVNWDGNTSAGGGVSS